MAIYSYTPSFEQVNWHTFWLLKQEHERTKEVHAHEVAALMGEVEALRAELAASKRG
jgi:hypothetical protein